MNALTQVPLVGWFTVVYISQFTGLLSKSQARILAILVIMEKNTPTTDPSLKDLIKLAGYTQKSFAQALNVAYSTLKYYISGENLPGLQILANMCRLLDKSPKEVMAALGIDVTGIPDDQPTDQ